MDVELVVTGDGSHSLYVPALKEHYHSTFGAISESKHVFIEAGLSGFKDGSSIEVFEVGFGTGLNAFLTLIEAGKRDLTVRYTAAEPYPPERSILRMLNYPEITNHGRNIPGLEILHDLPSGIMGKVTPYFSLKKVQEKLEDLALPMQAFDLVCFDAFGPDVQPELWTEEIFRKLAMAMKPGGVLVTYSAKGSVRRALKSAGFRVEKLPGPPGKREMTRAIIS